MTAIVIMEVRVRPLPGCTLIHADDDSCWTVVRNRCPSDMVVLDRAMVADALDMLRHGYAGGYRHGELWAFGSIGALAFRADLT